MNFEDGDSKRFIDSSDGKLDRVDGLEKGLSSCNCAVFVRILPA